jgi:hypothetical protein
MNKQQIIDLVIEEMKKDIAGGDLTAIDELLQYVPEENLKAYLPEPVTITIDRVIDLLERFEGEGCVTDDLLYYMRHNLNLTK